MEQLNEIGLPTIIIVVTGIFALIKGLDKCYLWAKKKFLSLHNHKNDNDKLKEDVDKHNQAIEELNVKLDKLSDLIIQQDEQNRQVDCSILRDRIIQSYKYHKGKGEITALDYENLNELFNQYFARGGNHLVSKIFEDFKQFKVNLDDDLLK